MMIFRASILLIYITFGFCTRSNAVVSPAVESIFQHVPITYGPRPFYLIDDMSKSDLKDNLTSCMKQLPLRTDFSIGHRGACSQFPEHTKESYLAAARMGAGIVECDVTFTKDLQLVCRHSQCDLHATTNILLTNLAKKCSQPFTPANSVQPASAKCCTSDITLLEFKTLVGKIDGVNPNATTVAEYVMGTPSWRTDWYGASNTVGTLVTHLESIDLMRNLNTKFIPELKAPLVSMPFKGYTQQMYAQQMINEYISKGIPPENVWPQSFSINDVIYWIRNTNYGGQAVYLDNRDVAIDGFDPLKPNTFNLSMKDLKLLGIKIIGPPIWMLLSNETSGRIVPSPYANEANNAGLKILTWTLERSGSPPTGYYYQSLSGAVLKNGDTYTTLHVLAQQVKILGIFTDWPATVTYYANCMNL